MSSIILIAGSNTNDLKKYLESRGSIDVVDSFNSLYGDIEEIASKILRADKLVYVYQEGKSDVRRDMQALRRLLIGDSYLTVEEIVFFVKETKESSQALAYFKDTIRSAEEKAEGDRSLRVPSSTIERTKVDLSYDVIYNSLLGVTRNVRLDNKILDVYRVERGSDSRVSYEEGDNRDVIIEPFSYESLNNYNRIQKAVSNTDSGELIWDSEVNQPMKLGNTDLGEVQFRNPSQKVELVLVSGNPKSGVSTFSTALASSSAHKGKKVLVLDITKKNGYTGLLELTGKNFQTWTVKDLLDNSLDEDGSLIKYVVGITESLRFNIVQWVISNMNTLDLDLIIIDCAYNDVKELSEILFGYDIKHFFMSGISAVEVEEVMELFKHVKEATLLLNDNVNYFEGIEIADVNKIKEGIANLQALVSPLKYKTLNLGGYLADRMLNA